MIDFFKRHPIISSIIAIVVFIIFYMAIGGGGSSDSGTTAVYGVDPNAAEYDLAGQQMENQLRLASLNVQGTLDIKREDNALQKYLADLAAGQASQQTDAEFQVAMAQLAASKEISQSTLQAQIRGAEITAGIQSQQIQALVQQAQINADVSKAAIKASSKKGLFSKIFG